MKWFRMARLFLEMIVLFAAAPLLLDQIVHGSQVPLIRALPLVFLLFVLLLMMDRDFSWLHTLGRGFRLRHAAEIFATFAVIGGVLIWYAYRYEPDAFTLPRRAPGLYWRIMLFYPLVSVITQEIVYRVFFFHRYHTMLGANAYVTIILSAAFFGFAHILMHGWIPLAASFAGGLLFAWRYHQTGSLWAVVFEHSLYGNLIFTAGFGRYFFTGVANVG
jgi:membrane protease YdiL (CAAX protease family)